MNFPIHIMKFLYVKTNHILCNLCVKTYHIWNPPFIYEIRFVNINQRVISDSYITANMWKQIAYEITLNSYTYMFCITEALKSYFIQIDYIQFGTLKAILYSAKIQTEPQQAIDQQTRQVLKTFSINSINNIKRWIIYAISLKSKC